MNIKETLQELGFESAVKSLDKKSEILRKTTIAYQHYEFVSEEAVEKFNEELKLETMKEDKRQSSFKRLRFTIIKLWDKIPPVEALEKLAEAQKLGCFDSFEIADIENVVVQKDPILFGRIEGCKDRFFIAQWDDDVTFEQIRKYSERIA